jgi:hypothetical protein
MGACVLRSGDVVTAVTHDGLQVCTDCADVLANGGENVEPSHADTMSAEWAGVPGQLVLACTDDEEDCPTFTSRPCDGCGSRLAGSRHLAVRLA